MTPERGALICIAAVAAGALNSVAGGGSFISFPALLFTGVPPIAANATNTVALWPGSVASAGAYRKELVGQKSVLVALASSSLIGGIAGAILLLRTPETVFLRLLPFLLLMATLVFAFGAKMTARMRVRLNGRTAPKWAGVYGAFLFQLIIATYGGYFGGGIGFLMLAMLTIMGMGNIHGMNAIKTVLASLINGVAVVTFIAARAVYWPQAGVMVVGAIAGGYGGACLARRIDPHRVRKFVIALGFTMTAIFFMRWK